MSPLFFYSLPGGGGQVYEVPAEGVEDWANKQPTSAEIPDWTPRSYSSTGQSRIWGREYDSETPKSKEIPIGRPVQADLPLAVLDSAATT
jgi:hypothetical protein